MLEALACGTPIAAYRVRGPIDVVKQCVTRYLSEKLNEAVVKALSTNSEIAGNML